MTDRAFEPPAQAPDETKPFFGMRSPRRNTSLPVISDDDQGEAAYDALKPGQKFTDSKGEVFTKPWVVKEDADWAQVPEGAEFIDEKGEKFKKPTYEPISSKAQYLFEISQTEGDKERALRTVYGDKVKKDPAGEFYVDDDGKLRKPGVRDISTFAGTFAAETPTAAGMILGGIGGEAVGGPPGAVGGAMAGAAVGREFNNSIMALFGIPQPLTQHLSSQAWEATGAGLGEVGGRIISRVPSAVRAVGEIGRYAKDRVSTGIADLAGGSAGQVLESLGVKPETMRSFLGLTEDQATQAAGIARRLEVNPKTGKFDSPLGPEIMGPEAPMWHKLAQWDRIWRTQNVTQQNVQKFAEQEAKAILENEAIGLQVTEPLTQSTKAVSAQHAGEHILAATTRDYAHSRAVFEDALRTEQAIFDKKIPAAAVRHVERVEQLAKAHQELAERAERMIHEQAAALQRDVEMASRLSAHDGDPSALNRMIAERYEIWEEGVRTQARDLYRGYDTMLRGEPPPDVSSLALEAEAFLRSMPEVLRARYPREIADIARLIDRDIRIPGVSSRLALPAGQIEPPQRFPDTIGWGDLHHLRSWLRNGIDYNEMTPDMKQGALRRFAGRVNAVLHDAQQQSPKMQQATRLLDQADAFYRSNIPFLNDQKIKSVMKELESGAGADAKKIAKLLFDKDHTAAVRRARSMIGENGWREVEAAHLQELLAQSQTRTPGIYDFDKFASQVLQLQRDGLIDAAYSPGMASRIRQLDKSIGQFKGEVPIEIGANDTLSIILRKGAAAKLAMDDAVAADPVGSLVQSMKDMQARFAEAAKRADAQVKEDPLGFLYQGQMTHMAAESAETILKSPDLIRLSAQRFGRDTPEFRGLQQVYAQRFFQRPFEKLSNVRSDLSAIPEEVQALMFPGVTREKAIAFSKDMDFLLGGPPTDIGGSLAGSTRVLNPTKYLPFPMPGDVAKFVFNLPGINMASRYTLGKMLAFFVDASANPNFALWLAGELKGSPQQREFARQVVSQRLKQAMGLAGGLVGQQELRGVSEEEQPQVPVQRFAEGGVITQPTLAMLGERGPEAVIPLDDPAKAQQAAEQARQVAAGRQRQAVQPEQGRQQGELTEGALDFMIPGRGAIRAASKGDYGEAAVQAGLSAVTLPGAGGVAAKALASPIGKAIAASTAALATMFVDDSAGAPKLSPENMEKLRMQQEQAKQRQQERESIANQKRQEAEATAAREAQAAQQAAQTQADLQAKLAEIEAKKEADKLRIQQEKDAHERAEAEATIARNAAENKRMAERPFRERHPDAALGMTIGGIGVAMLIPGGSQAFKTWAFNNFAKEFERLDAAAAEALLRGTPQEQQLAVNRLTAAAAKQAEAEGKLHKFPWLTQLAAPGAAVEGSLLPQEIDMTQPKGSAARESAQEFFSTPSEWGQQAALFGGGGLAGLTGKEAVAAFLKQRNLPSTVEGTVKTFAEQEAARKKAATAAKRAETRATKKEPEKEKEPRRAKVPRSLEEMVRAGERRS